MLVLTTPNIEGRIIDSYQGIVSGEAILGGQYFQRYPLRVSAILSADVRARMSQNSAEPKI